MEKAAAKPPLPHDLILESRSKLTVTGVQRVLHCSAESAERGVAGIAKR